MKMSGMPRRRVLFGAVAAAPLAAAAVWPPPATAASPSSLVDVRDFGAVGDGKADDTAAIEAAFAASAPEGAVYFPPGTYAYNGPGLNAGFSPAFIGAASGATKISLGPDSYFVNYSGHLKNFLLRDISFDGGKGVVKHTYTGVNVAGQYLVQDCCFQNYSECAISTDAADMPYWRIRDCIFEAADTVGTIGIALPSGTDQCAIESCSFIRNRVHLKARGGNNLQISGCDFIQFSPDNSGGPRVGVWITPDPGAVNAGTGLAITGCKFGNENLQPGDFRILYADDPSGKPNGQGMPELDADSSGYVAGHNIALNSFFGTGADSHPLIYSTTPNVRALHVHSNVLEGGQPSYLIQFRTIPIAPDRITSNSVFGPFLGTASTESDLPFSVSNADGVGYLVDPQGLQQRATTIRTWAAGSSASYRQVLFEEIRAFSAVGATIAGVPDPYGGPEALRLTMDSGTASLHHPLRTPFIVGMPVWVEFDIASPNDGRSAAQISVWVGDDKGAFHWRRCIEVPAAGVGWITYAFSFTPRTAGNGEKIVFGATGESESGKTVHLARPRVYQANERQLGGLRPSVAGEAKTPEDAVALVNELRNTLIGMGLIAGVPPAVS